MEILCKKFSDFQTWIRFFSTFFEQNEKTRKLRKSIYLELQLSQFSAKSETKKFFTFSLQRSFYKGFPWKFFFTRKSFVNFFLIFKLESDFFPHFLSKVRKLENCAHLFIVGYKCAKLKLNKKKTKFPKFQTWNWIFFQLKR